MDTNNLGSKVPGPYKAELFGQISQTGNILRVSNAIRCSTPTIKYFTTSIGIKISEEIEPIYNRIKGFSILDATILTILPKD